MEYQVIRLLEPQEAAAFVTELAKCEFKDGRLTAQGQARGVKNNLQLVPGDDGGGDGLHQRMSGAFQRSAPLREFTFSRRFTRPMFNRYEGGMTYGAHVDNAMMGGFGGVRTDFSITVFLSPPSTYQGGELVIHLPSGDEAVKLDAGEAVVYSGGAIHHVEPVTEGVRLAAVSWIQSAIRDARLREALHDLGLANQRADALKDAELQLRLSKTYHSLLRYAAEA